MLSHDSAPDLVIYNGAIHTLHAALPRCPALACKPIDVSEIHDTAQQERDTALSLRVPLSLRATTRNPVVVQHWIPDQVRDDSH